MPIVAECPGCGLKRNVADQFKGRKIKCRECAHVFVIGGENIPAAPAEKQSNPEPGALDFLGNASNGSAADGPSPFADLDIAAPEPPQPKRPAASAKRKPDSEEEVPAKKAGAKRAFKKKADVQPLPVAAIVLGVLALILGVAGLAIRHKGLFGLASVPLSGLGLLLAVGGLFTGRGQPGIGLPAPGLGLLVCLAALPLGGIETYKLIASGVLSDAPAADKTASTDPTSPAPKPESGGPMEPVPVDPADGQWANPKHGIRLRKAIIRLTRADIDFFRPKGAGPNVSSEKHLTLLVEITNTGRPSIDYFGWALTNRRMLPTLTDDSGNKFQRVGPDRRQLDGQVDQRTIPFGQTIGDFLIFEAPPDHIRYLRLELSAANLDGTGTLRFQIPKAMLTTRAESQVQAPGPKKDQPQVPLPPPAPLPPLPPLPPPPPGDVKGSKEVEALRQTLKKQGPQSRAGAALALGNLGAEAGPAVPDLIGGLRDPIADVRLRCAEALGKIGPPAKVAIPWLIAALRDEFWRVQAAAAKSLGQMGPAAKDAIPELRRLTRSRDEEVPDRAKEAIRKIDPNAARK